MLIFRKKKLFPILLLLVTFVSVDMWLEIKISNRYINWTICISILLLFLHYIKKKRINLLNGNYTIVSLFLIWVLISAIRGIFVIEDDWDTKNLIDTFFSLSISLCVFYLRDRHHVAETLRVWFKYSIPVFFVFFIWVLRVEAYHYYLSPLFIFGCFLIDLPHRWRYIIATGLLVMLSISLEARTQILTSFITILMAIVLYIYRNKSKSFADKCLKSLQFLFYLLPLLFLLLGLVGSYNIFEDMEMRGGKMYNLRIEKDGRMQDVNMGIDTRSFIYYEVIQSAINNDYVLFGRTLARGNDTGIQLYISTVESYTKRMERHANEVGMLNIFTWLGVVGLILYMFIFFKASWVAIYDSNNIYIKLIGCLVAFHFMFGWVEDYQNYSIHTFVIWIEIAMCLSEEFRTMTDLQFREWINTCFSKNIRYNNR